MEWNVEYTDEFGEWWDRLTESDRNKIDASVGLLIEHGPNLGHPHSSKINGSRHSQMRELRVQRSGRPYRIFYAFDPRRSAILLIGGDKTGDERFYDVMIPRADALYDAYLIELKNEGHI